MIAERITIAVDAMGGDNAPECIIRGICEARLRYPQLTFKLYGDEKRLAPMVSKEQGLAEICDIVHCPDVISMAEKPSIAVRQGKKSSMFQAVKAVKSGEAQGIISAGNTGALMAIAKLQLRTLPEIARPAIAAILPTTRGECTMLDLGANAECDADNLFQFAVMGEAFARAVLGIRRPIVSLLNIGEEETKGRAEVQEAAKMLREADLPMQFNGYIEGNDLPLGKADVVVSDGFSGNIALKTAEGTAELCINYFKDAFKSSWWSRLGYFLARPALSMMFKRMDPRLHNGAMLLGLNGVVVKSHGGTDALGFANAIGVAANLITYDVNRQITEELQRSQGDALLQDALLDKDEKPAYVN